MVATSGPASLRQGLLRDVHAAIAPQAPVRLLGFSCPDTLEVLSRRGRLWGGLFGAFLKAILVFSKQRKYETPRKHPPKTKEWDKVVICDGLQSGKTDQRSGQDIFFFEPQLNAAQPCMPLD